MSDYQTMMQSSEDRPDIGFRLIVGLVGAVSAWLICMPLVPAVARCTMNRFHLSGNSFACWAIQQPIPAMYNLANRYSVYGARPEQWINNVASTKLPEAIESGYVNHFPTRLITFADARYRLLQERRERWYQFESSYRGQSLCTRVLVRPTDDRVQSMIRLEKRIR